MRAQPGPPTDAEEEVVEGKTYVPDAEGFKVTLPDGVSTQVRFWRAAAHPTLPRRVAGGEPQFPHARGAHLGEVCAACRDVL